MKSKFRTKVDVKQFPFSIGYNTPTLMLGSCFTNNIGELLVERKFPVIVNPFGVVYNPTSVALVLNRIINGSAYTEDDLINHNGLWLSLHHHSSFSDASKELCLKKINGELAKAHQFMAKSQRIILTLGTARIYNYKKTRLPVANCHKIPANEFTRHLLSVDEIVNEWNQLIEKILQKQPDQKIVFTVSPVRHWKDGAHGNQISKATLLLAIEQLAANFKESVFYFPSYEIMMDDLRDYRFYADDMLHPSPLAIEYIWEKFYDAFVTTNDQKLIKEVESIIRACQHRPFNANTSQHKEFTAKIRKKITEIERRTDGISFADELLLLSQNT